MASGPPPLAAACEDSVPALRVLTQETLFRQITAFMRDLPGFVREFGKIDRPGSVFDARYPQRSGLLPHAAIIKGDERVLMALYEFREHSSNPYYFPDKLRFENVLGCAVAADNPKIVKLVYELMANDKWCWDGELMYEAVLASHYGWQMDDKAEGYFYARPCNLGIMEWFFQHAPHHRIRLCRTVPDGSAGRGDLAVVKWLHEHGYQFTKRIMDEAAKGEFARETWERYVVPSGPVEIVKFPHYNRTEGCTTAAMDGAAACGDLEVVRFPHEHRARRRRWTVLPRMVT